MKQYTVAQPVTLRAGAILVLTSAQLGERARQVKVLESNEDHGLHAVEVTGEVQFKAGEVIGMDGEPPKALRQVLSAPAAELVGVADDDGNVTPLEDMKKADLLAMALEAGIAGAEGMTKAQLVEALRDGAEPGELQA